MEHLILTPQKTLLFLQGLQPNNRSLAEAELKGPNGGSSKRECNKPILTFCYFWVQKNENLKIGCVLWDIRKNCGKYTFLDLEPRGNKYWYKLLYSFWTLLWKQLESSY
jgi:hypothetical protein